MVMTDSIADMLTRIRNANKAKMVRVDIPASRIKIGIAKILKEEGYIKHYKIVKNKNLGVLRIFLKYNENEEPVINMLKRVSRPGKRVYTDAENLKPVRGGLGISIISTSKGLMTGVKAKKNNIGGERLLIIY